MDNTHLSGISSLTEPGYKSNNFSKDITTKWARRIKSHIQFPYGSILSTWKRRVSTDENFGFNISATFPKAGALEIHLGYFVLVKLLRVLRKRNIDRRDGNCLEKWRVYSSCSRNTSC